LKNQPAAPVCEAEVDFTARAIIAQHGPDAALAAEDHLDELTRLGSTHRRDTWAEVIHAIHEFQRRLGPDAATGSGPDQLRQLGTMGR
jgi:hypothetical protein